MLIQELVQRTADGPGGLVTVLSLSSFLAVLAGGVAWGKMGNRVKALEDSDFICRDEFNFIKDAIGEIREDVREIRRRMQ